MPNSAKLQAPSHKRSRRVVRVTLMVLASVVALLALIAATLLAAAHTERGSRLTWQLAQRLAPVTLEGEWVSGTFARGMHLRNLRFHDARRRLHIDRLQADWQFDFSSPAVRVERLDLGTVDLTLLPTPPEPRTLPADLRLPLAIALRKFHIREVAVNQDNSTTRITDIRLDANSDTSGHMLHLVTADTQAGKLQATLNIDGKRPFSLQGKARLAGEWQGERFVLDATLSGTLQRLGVALLATGDRLKGTAELAATPFGELPFQHARIDVHNLNPQLFHPAAPKADLSLRADIAPIGETTDSGKFIVSGPLSLRNAIPGAIDRQLLPLSALEADLRLQANVQLFENLRAHLRGGELTGSARIETRQKSPSSSPPQQSEQSARNGILTLQARKLDLRALHSKLPASALDGPLSAAWQGTHQQLTMNLADGILSMQARLNIHPEKFDLQRAELGIAGGKLAFRGSMSRTPRSAFLLEGKLSNVNPGPLLAVLPKSVDNTPKSTGANRAKSRTPKTSPAPKPINASINADFIAEGELQPALALRLGFDIAKSTYDGLPMTGTGRVQLAAQRLAASHVQLSVAGNRLVTEGSFGAPADRLTFAIDAPALARLGLDLSGLLKANGVVGGTLRRPIIETTARAEKLAFAGYRLAALSGEVRTNGVPGNDPKAQIALRIDATDLDLPQLTLRDLKANIDGTYASHTIDLRASGQARGQPLNISLAAQGQLSEIPPANGAPNGAPNRAPSRLAWNGTLRTFENRGFPQIVLQEPLLISFAPGSLRLGPSRLQLEKSQIVLRELDIRGGRIRSEGSLANLDLAHLLTLQRQFMDKPAPLRSDLVFDGAWNVDWGSAAEGYIALTRRSGDITLRDGNRGGELGLSSADLRADLRGDHIDLGAKLAAKRIGNLDLTAQLGVLRSNGLVMLAPESSLVGRVTAQLPRLQNIAALAGPRVGLEGNAKLEITLAGSVGDPVFSGVANGNNLALTLYEQGLRLRDGIARLRLNDNVIELEEVLFRGGDGTLRATGQIPLHRTLTDLRATIVADRLQLLASPTGQLTLSGQAIVANLNEHPQLNGKFTVDRARFSRPEQSAPTLDDDVVVIRGTQRLPAQAGKDTTVRPTSPFSPIINVELDLGSDFRFEGAGAKLLLAGSVTARSTPGELPQAEGTIRVVKGSYEAFGTELVIERGRINFQGPFTNPALNILAMRPIRQDEQVRAGALITGTAQRPRVELVTEPNVSEEEKLSWLVFGRGGSNTEAARAQGAAQGAALGLLNSVGGSRIAKSIGLDQLFVGNSEFGLARLQVVNLGKEISDNLYVGFEQSLAGGASIVKLTYELSRSWSVVARGGTISGVDMQFSRRFDYPPRQTSSAEVADDGR